MANNYDILVRRLQDMLVYFTATEIRMWLDVVGHDEAAKHRRSSKHQGTDHG